MQPIRLRPRWLIRGEVKRRELAQIELDLELIRRLGSGQTWQEISDELGIPVKTIKWRIDRCRRRAGARTHRHFFVIATQAGIFD